MKADAQKNPGRQPREIELKLQIDPADIDQLSELPLLKKNAIGQPRIQQINSTYYDTAEFEFKRHGASLRLRQRCAASP